MFNQSEYYYGQGKVYLSTYANNGQWRWIGDVSSLKVNLEFEEQFSKRSIGGRLVKDRRYITFTGGNLTATWFERSIENLSLILHGNQTTSQQSWQREKFNGILAGMNVSLKYQNIKDISIQNLTENIDFFVNYESGLVQFVTTPPKQPFFVEYDFSVGSGVGILNGEKIELAMRYAGINLANNNDEIFVEFYRLSLDPAEAITLIDDKSEFSNIETELQLLPDLTKSPKSDFGLFGHYYKRTEFNTIYCNDEIFANDDYYAAY